MNPNKIVTVTMRIAVAPEEWERLSEWDRIEKINEVVDAASFEADEVARNVGLDAHVVGIRTDGVV